MVTADSMTNVINHITVLSKKHFKMQISKLSANDSVTNKNESEESQGTLKRGLCCQLPKFSKFLILINGESVSYSKVLDLF